MPDILTFFTFSKCSFVKVKKAHSSLRGANLASFSMLTLCD